MLTRYCGRCPEQVFRGTTDTPGISYGFEGVQMTQADEIFQAITRGKAMQ